jgi:hypothetical protein
VPGDEPVKYRGNDRNHAGGGDFAYVQRSSSARVFGGVSTMRLDGKS